MVRNVSIAPLRPWWLFSATRGKMHGRAVIVAALLITITGGWGLTGAQAASVVVTGVKTLAQAAQADRRAAPLARGLTVPAADATAVRLAQGTVYLDPSRVPAVNGDSTHVLLQLRGPLSEEQKNTLTRLGVELLDYIPEFTWKARVRGESLAAVRALSFVHALGALYPADKLPPAILSADFHPRSLNADGSLSLAVTFHPGVSYARAAGLLQALDAVPLQADFMSGAQLGVRLPQARVLDLLNVDEVAWVEDREAPKASENTTAAKVSRVDHLWQAPNNLSGAGLVVGMWDEGLVDVSHPDLTSHVTTGEAGKVVGHATHVAGTLTGAGNGNAAARGMAPGAAVWSYDYYGDPVAEHAAARKDHGIVAANNSWGYLAGWQNNYYSDGYWVWFGGAANQSDPDFGGYSSLTRNWDRMIYDTALVVVKSAGNDRNDGGASGRAHRHYGDTTTLFYDQHDADGDYRSIGQIATAKNIITVGAVDKAKAMTAFSAWGPTNDGRIKPDLVAEGQDVYSTFLGGSYTSLSGTSMASPTVSGAIALLLERYRGVTGNASPPPSELVRALLVNTAADLGAPGPDYMYGWGLLDAEAALKVIEADGGSGRRLITDNLNQGVTKRYDIEVGAEAGLLKVTLAWTDPPGSPSAAAVLVNDLDIKLISPGGETYYPYSLAGLGDPAAPATTLGANTVDNLEQARVSAPQAGLWRIEVNGSRVQLNQAFALVSSIDMPEDRTPPGGGYVVINQGGEYALSSQASVFVAGFDNQGVTGYYLSEHPARPGLGQFTAVATAARLSLTLPYALSAGDGVKTLYLWLRDASGNISEPASAAVTLDTTPPAAPLLSVTAGKLAGRPLWEWQALDGNGRFRYQLNDPRMNVGAVETQALSFIPGAPLSAGRHTLYVQARDDAGHWSASAQASIRLSADEVAALQALTAGGTPPQAPNLWGNTPVNHPLPQWQWRSMNGGGIYRLRLDAPDLSAAVETTAQAFIPASPLNDGVHTLYVQERGGNGLWSPVTAFEVLIDTAAPVTTTRVSSTAASSTQWVSLICDDAGAGCAATYYTVDGSKPTRLSPRYSGAIAISANTTLRFLSFDQAGNEEGDRTETYSIDTPAQSTSSGGGGGVLGELLLLLSGLLLRFAARSLSDLGDRSEQGGRARPVFRSFEGRAKRRVEPSPPFYIQGDEKDRKNGPLSHRRSRSVPSPTGS